MIILVLVVHAFAGAGAVGAESYVFKAKWGIDTMSRSGYFDNASAAVTDSAGNLYVADTDNHRVQKFSPSGDFLIKWGSYGKEVGQFAYPRGIALDNLGYVYVADTLNHRVQKFTTGGVFVAQWSTIGTVGDPGRLPSSLAVDSTGNVYIAGLMASQIRKYAPDGTFITSWGTYGEGDGQFNFPRAVALDASQNVYVADTGNHRIQKFTSSGAFVAKWGSSGTAAGQFYFPAGIALDSSGKIYVADMGNGRIQCFTPTFSPVDLSADYAALSLYQGFYQSPLLTIDKNGNIYTYYFQGWIIMFPPKQPYIYAVDIGSYAALFRFHSPRGVAVDGEGNVFIPDTGSGTIYKMGPDKAGGPDEMWLARMVTEGIPMGITLDASGNLYIVDTANNQVGKYIPHIFPDYQYYTPDTAWGSFGIGTGQLQRPSSLVADVSGNIYVADAGNDRIQKFASDGTVLGTWGKTGTEDGNFHSPMGVGLDGTGNVYVADSGNNRIQKFTAAGAFIGKWGAAGTGDGEFRNPTAVATDGAGNVFVADRENNRIQKFASDGTFIMKWGSFGTADGQLNAPSGIAVDLSGNVYVADRFNNRIQKFVSLSCTYGLSSPPALVPADGSSYNMTITAGAGCPWTASSDVPWIDITDGASGSGNGTVKYTVATNTDPVPRTGTLTIAGQIVSINQAAKTCSLTIKPLAKAATYKGGKVTVSVTSNGCNWQATPVDGWLTITAGASGMGKGKVTIQIAPNTSSLPRTGSVLIADKTFVVAQAGAPCNVALLPVSAMIDAVGGLNSFNITVAPADCSWFAISSVPSWLEIVTPAASTGSGTLEYSVLQNDTGKSRKGKITVVSQKKKKTFSVSQASD